MDRSYASLPGRDEGGGAGTGPGEQSDVSARRRLHAGGLPPRSLFGRLLTLLLVLLSATFLVMTKADLRLVDALENRSGDIAAPAMAVLQVPMLAARGLARDLGTLLALRAENDRLRREIDELLAWQGEAARLGVENRSLRAALAIPAQPGTTTVTTALVVADPAGSFVRTRLIDAGAERGVAVGQVAMEPQGLVGRVVAVGERSARILLLTDLNSKIPVLIERSGDRAILEGDNGRTPHLRFLPADPRFQVGDRVLTSGDGGLIPAGLPIGEIGAIRGPHVDVVPYADWERLDHVRILQGEPVVPPDDAPAARSRPMAFNLPVTP